MIFLSDIRPQRREVRPLLPYLAGQARLHPRAKPLKRIEWGHSTGAGKPESRRIRIERMIESLATGS